MPPNATAFCGLGPKIRVSYQCEGRETVLEMLQSPNFSDVIGSCKMPLSLDTSCKRCLNSGINYLHHLIGAEDNVTLSICRNAAFVALASQGDNMLAVDMSSCFFGVKGLSNLTGLTIQTVILVISIKLAFLKMNMLFDHKIHFWNNFAHAIYDR